MTFKFISFQYDGVVRTCDSSGRIRKSRAMPRTADQMTITYKQKPPEPIIIQEEYQIPAPTMAEVGNFSNNNQLEQMQEIFSCFNDTELIFEEFENFDYAISD